MSKIFNLSLIQIRSYKKNKRTFILNYKKIEFFYVGVDRKCEYKYRVYFSITCSKNNEKKKTKQRKFYSFNYIIIEYEKKDR